MLNCCVVNAGRVKLYGDIGQSVVWHCKCNFSYILFVIPAVRMERLSDAARTNQDALRGTQEEIAEYRRQLQSRTIELETLRGTKESLERQRVDSEERHHDDLNSLQAGNKHDQLTDLS